LAHRAISFQSGGTKPRSSSEPIAGDDVLDRRVLAGIAVDKLCVTGPPSPLPRPPVYTCSTSFLQPYVVSRARTTMRSAPAPG
jgi:hypothetical protein